jgi:flagellar protein FliO/FliZ
MDTVDPARFLFASFVVLALLALLAIVLRRYGNNFSGTKLFAMNQKSGRIAIVEAQYIDPKSKLLLIKRDDIEHLVLIGDGKAIVIESGIKRDA